MKISLFQGIMLGGFAVAAVIGVFVFATYKGNSPSDALGTVEIWGTLPQEAFDTVLGAARQVNTALKSVSYAEKNPNTLESDLLRAIAEGHPPDMILTSQEELLPLVKIIQIIPSATLSERTFKDTFASGSEIFLSPDGSGSYGRPFLIDPIVLFQNRAILASSGIAEAPGTWEGLTGLVPKIVTKTPAGSLNQSLIALGTYSNIHDARGILSGLFLQSGAQLSVVSANGYRRADLGLSQFNGTPSGQAVVRFYTQFSDPVKVSYTWNASLPDSQQRFLTGDLALYLGYASEAGYFAEANPNLDFDVAPFPQLATSGAKTTFGLVYGFVIPNASKNPVGAYAAASVFTDVGVERIAAAATHMAPVVRALLASPPSAGRASVAYSSALYAKGWLSPTPYLTDNVFSTMISNVITGRLTPEAALSSAESALSTLLQR
jgi:ABC-type glycerol-3-phosphate transport system substrate-binding protein